MFHVEHDERTRLLSLLTQSAAEFSFHLSPQQADAVVMYLEELTRWNRTFNLTAIEDSKEIVIKHFIDSIACFKFLHIQPDASVLDIAAGAGFPGMPMKLIRSNINVDFLEPNKKKAAFLNYIIGRLKLSGSRTFPARLEEFARGVGGLHRYDFIVVRAFKVQLYPTQIRTLLRPDGALLLYRAAKVDFSLEGLALIREVEYELPSGFGHRVLSLFSPS
jgi:16S rRNA (guanine527-N7)-methyltransferase